MTLEKNTKNKKKYALFKTTLNEDMFGVPVSRAFTDLDDDKELVSKFSAHLAKFNSRRRVSSGGGSILR